jgi:hypothetical protein
MVSVLAKRRVPDCVLGIGELHALVAEHANDDESIVVGIEVDRGLLVLSLVSAGYEVFAINSMASARYRDRHAVSGDKSDPGDAKCWPTWSAPIGTITARWPAIRIWLRG